MDQCLSVQVEQWVQQGSMWKTIKFYSVTGIIVALAMACVYLWFFGGRHGVLSRTVNPPAIVQEIQKLSELVTVRYGVQKVVGLQEEKVPFGSEKLLLLVRAEVLGGVDLSKLTPADVQVRGAGGLTIRLPPAAVLHVYPNEKETQVWDRSKTWWTPWVPYNPELDKKARLAALEEVQIAALEMGILAKARQNAETVIRDFLHVMGVEHVEFTNDQEGPQREPTK